MKRGKTVTKNIKLMEKQLQELQPFFERVEEYSQEAYRLKREARGSRGMVLAQTQQNGECRVMLIPPILAIQIYDAFVQYLEVNDNET